MKEFINDALEEYIERGTYPWHMPGHKRQPVEKNGEASAELWNQMYAHDFTEAKDLDDMHEPQSFIADSLVAMKNVYGTYATYMLVNGSTSGIMTAIHGVCRRGDVVLVARNCHKAVYNAVCMLELQPEYVVPEYLDIEWPCLNGYERRKSDILGDISGSQIETRVKELVREGRKPSAIVITSPTYEGVISDIKAISETAHRYGIYLIVDEAQGAHLKFMENHHTAMQQGADIVIESLHKTMPALTQTSLLHVMAPELDESVRRYLQIFQTSSPSYIFMQSIEKAVSYGAGNRMAFVSYGQRLSNFREACGTLTNIRLFSPESYMNVYDYDEGRLVFVIRPGTTLPGGRKLTGKLLADELADRYGLIVEMASVSYIICISSVVDSAKSYDILLKAIEEIDSGTVNEEDSLNVDKTGWCSAQFHFPRVHLDMISDKKYSLPPGKAWNMPVERVGLSSACGRISGDFIYAYPPGIPVIAPGEIFDRQTIECITSMDEEELNVSGIREGTVRVLTSD